MAQGLCQAGNLKLRSVRTGHPLHRVAVQIASLQHTVRMHCQQPEETRAANKTVCHPQPHAQPKHPHGTRPNHFWRRFLGKLHIRKLLNGPQALSFEKGAEGAGDDAFADTGNDTAAHHDILHMFFRRRHDGALSEC